MVGYCPCYRYTQNRRYVRCTECKCELYYVTMDEYGRDLRLDYKGGLLCWYDYTRCKLKEGFEGLKRSLYLRYIVKWVDWDDFIVPVKIYIIDVTDSLKQSNNSKWMNSDHDSKVNEFINALIIIGSRSNILQNIQILITLNSKISGLESWPVRSWSNGR